MLLFFSTEEKYTETSIDRYYRSLQSNVDLLDNVVDDTDIFYENLVASPQVIAFLEDIHLQGLESNLLDPETHIAKNTNLFIYDSRGYRAYRRLYGMISSSREYSALALLNPSANLSIITSENGQYGAVCSSVEDLCRFLGIQELDSDWEDKTLILAQPTAYSACEAYVLRKVGDQLILLCGVKEGVLKNTLTANLGQDSSEICQMVVQSPTGQAVSLYPDTDLESMKIDITGLSTDSSVQTVNGYAVMLFPGEEHHFRMLTVLQKEGISRVIASSRFQLFLFANIVWLLIVVLIASYMFFRVFRPIKKISAGLGEAVGGGDDLERIYTALNQYEQLHQREGAVINAQMVQLRNSYLRHLVWGHYPSISQQEQDELGIPQLLSRYMLMVVYPGDGNWGGESTRIDGQMEPKSLAKIERSLREEFRTEKLVTITIQEYLLVIIPLSEAGKEEDIRQHAVHSIERIQLEKKKEFCFGLSNLAHGQKSLGRAYHEAVLNTAGMDQKKDGQSEEASMSVLLKQNLQMADLIQMNRFEDAYTCFCELVATIFQQKNWYLRNRQLFSFLTMTFFMLIETNAAATKVLAENHVDTNQLVKLEDEQTILKKWGEVFSYLKKQRSIETQKEYSNQFIQIYQYMQANFRKIDFSLNLLAEEFQIAPSTLSREFQKNTGQGFLELLHGMRIEAAKYEIQHTNASLKEIAASVGYSNVLTMTRAFKKYVGCTPGEFRKKSRFD